MWIGKQLNECLYRKNLQEQMKIEGTSNSEAFLPYISGITEDGWLLTKYMVKTISTQTIKFKDHFRSAKDKRNSLSALRVFEIRFSFRKVHVGPNQRSLQERMTELKSNCRLGCTENSAIAHHTVNQNIIIESDFKIYSSICWTLVSVKRWEGNFDSDDGLSAYTITNQTMTAKT